MKLLVISDTHIPSRSNLDISKFLTGKNYDYLIHCGDFERWEILNELKAVSGNKFIGVRGNCDDIDIQNALSELVLQKFDGIDFGVFHSHNIYPRGDKNQLLAYAKQNKFKVGIFGHIHYKYFVGYKDGKFIDLELNSNILNLSNYLDKYEYLFICPGSMIEGDYLEIEFYNEN